MHLLDINVLIAVVDPFHVHHDTALNWFVEHRYDGWATCPITENGFIRILSNPKYPDGPGSSHAARALILHLCAQPGHQFWPDSISLTNLEHYPALPASRNLTDLYLLALATRHRAGFATLDQRIEAGLVPGGSRTIHYIKP